MHFFSPPQSGEQAETAAAGNSTGQSQAQAVEVHSSAETSTSSAAAKLQGSSGAGAASEKSITCSLCGQEVMCENYTQHLSDLGCFKRRYIKRRYYYYYYYLSDFHVKEQCEHCGAKAWGIVGLSQHLENCRPLNTIPPSPPPRPSPPPPPPTTTPSTPPHPPTAQEVTPVLQSICSQDAPTAAAHTAQESICPQDAPIPAPHKATSAPPGPPHPLRPPEVSMVRYLPKQFLKIIKAGDQEWIAQILYEKSGQLRQKLSQNWFNPPNPTRSTSPPEPQHYFRQRLFLWAPMRMWAIPLKCSQCNTKMHHSQNITLSEETTQSVVSARYLSALGVWKFRNN